MEKCKRMKRPQFTSKSWIYSWQWKSSKILQQFYRSETFAMNTDTLTSGSTVKNHISIENGIRIQCNTENFVPIVVPGLSTSSSFNFPSSTSMTPSRQEIDHLTFSSSSSTSPPMTSSTVWSESVAREERETRALLKSRKSCQLKTQNQIKMRITIKNGETRAIPKSRSGCKNSEKI